MKKILFLLTMFIFANAKSQDTCINDARIYTNTNITANGVRAITGAKLNTSLNKIIDAIDCVGGGVFIATDSNTVINYNVLNSQNAPPVSPIAGDTYLVGTVPTGAWVGHAKDIATWDGSAWTFIDGVQGDYLYNTTNLLTYIYRSGNWVQTGGIPALNNGNTISSGLRIGTNNLKSLTFETNNVPISRFDSIGNFYLYNTPNGDINDTFVVVQNPTTGKVSKVGKSNFAGGAALSGLTAATATNNIFNTNYKQRWNWNTIAGDTALVLASTSTGAANNLQNLLTVSQSGANTISDQTTYGGIFSNTKTGTTSTNIGLMAIATGATNNIPIYAKTATSEVLRLQSTGTSGRWLSYWDNTVETGRIGFFSGNTNTFNVQLDIVNKTALGGIGMFVNSKTTPSLFVQNSGAVGINNASPFATLDIVPLTTNNYAILMSSGGIYKTSTASSGAGGFELLNTTFSGSSGAHIQINSSGVFSIFHSASTANIPTGINLTSTNDVGIGASPSASAKLEVSSTTQGFLPPRMTATQASAISTPAQGLLLFVSDTNGTFTSVGWWGYNGSTWEKLNN